MAKKSAIIGEYIITVEDSGSVNVLKIYDNVIQSLRECAVAKEFKYDPEWTTRQFGAKLIKEFGEGKEATIGEYTIVKRDNDSIETYRAFKNTMEGLREVAERIDFEINENSNTRNNGSKIVDFINSGEAKLKPAAPKAKNSEKASEKGDETEVAEEVAAPAEEIVEKKFYGKIEPDELEKMYPKYSEGVASVKIDGKYGYVDEEGNIVIEPKFDSADRFNGGIAEVKVNGKYGFIDLNGDYLIEPKCSYVSSFDEEYGVARVDFDGKYGLIDKTAKFLIEPTYDRIDWFTNGVTRTQLNDKWGLIDHTGKVLFEPVYDYIEIIGGVLVSLRVEDESKDYGHKYGFADLAGNILYETIFEYFSKIGEGLISVQLNGLYGIIDLTGKYIVEPKYKKIESFKDDLAVVKTTDEKYGFINTECKEVIEPKFDYARDFREGMAEVKLNGKYGLIDTTGNYIAQPIFDSIGKTFDDGLTSVEINEKWGFIDKEGKMVIEPTFDGVDEYFDHDDWNPNWKAVKVGDKYGIIDEAGNMAIEPKYDEIKLASEGMIGVGVDVDGEELFGFINEQGEMVIEPRYTYISEGFYEGVARVEVDGDYDIEIDTEGNQV